MSTITITDQTARTLEHEAKELGLSVGDLVEVMAEQFLTGRGPVFELTEHQILQIRQSMDDPHPSIPHDEVVAEIDRLIDKGE